MPFEHTPFEPHLIQPDEPPQLPDGELDLPPGLAALGEQLRDDARHLAARFPAERGLVAAELVAAKQPSAISPGTRWKELAAVAAGGLAMFFLGLVTIQSLPNNQQPTGAMVAASGAVETTLSAAPGTAPVPAAAPSAPPLPAVTGTAAELSLTELSGPELEALLDLWQHEPTSPAGGGISF